MKVIDKIINNYEGARGPVFRFAEFYYEHNGHKFKVHYEAEDSVPCASVGMDWYQSLSIMTSDGTWKQVSDAKVVGACTHYELDNNKTREAKIKEMLDDADKKFQDYIVKLWS